MMEQKLSRLKRYFDGQIALCDQRNKELLADDRIDEAAFERVRANVYDIFRTVLSAAVKACSGNPDAVRRFFVQKTEQIPANWAAAYERARQHNDAVRLQIEQIKLDTIREIKESFATLWEEAT